MAAGAGAAAGGHPVCRRRATRRTEGEPRARHEPRDGQGARGDPWRRPGSDRHDPLHGRRRPPALRRDGALRVARQVRHVAATAARRLFADHTVEFSRRDSILEDRPGPGVRQHGSAEALEPDATLGRELRQGPARRGRSRRRRQPGDRRRGGRHRPGDPSVGQGRVVHRLDRGWPHRQPECRAGLQEGSPRDGWQERHHRHGRRPVGAGDRRVPVGRFRHQRAAVHGGEPGRRARSGLRPLPCGIRRPGPRPAGWQRPRRARADGALSERSAAATGGRLCRHRHSRGGTAGDRRPAVDRGRLLARLVSRTDRVRRRRPRRCGSRRRRSSGRSCR